MRRHLFACLVGFSALFSLAACKDTTVPESKITPAYTFDHWSKLTPTQKSQGHVSPQAGRQARRIGLPQLRSTIPKLFDGMTWTDRDGRDMFARLSQTLGQADYIFLTENTRDATPLFMKFMDDMAGNLCKKAVDRDMAGENPKKLVILDERDIDKTLRFLRLKFHTIHVPDGSTEGINDLRKLYDRVLVETSDRKKAWYAVCFSTLTAPEFFAY